MKRDVILGRGNTRLCKECPTLNLKPPQFANAQQGLRAKANVSAQTLDFVQAFIAKHKKEPTEWLSCKLLTSINRQEEMPQKETDSLGSNRTGIVSDPGCLSFSGTPEVCLPLVGHQDVIHSQFSTRLDPNPGRVAV